MKKNQIMSDSERELMKLIWDNGGEIYIAELLEKVSEKNKDWKRTTVLTFLARLSEKGYILTEKHGRMCKYIATTTEEQYLARQTENFIHEMYSGNAKNLVSSLLKQDCLSQEDFEELKDFWNQGRR